MKFQFITNNRNEKDVNLCSVSPMSNVNHSLRGVILLNGNEREKNEMK